MITKTFYFFAIKYYPFCKYYWQVLNCTICIMTPAVKVKRVTWHVITCSSKIMGEKNKTMVILKFFIDIWSVHEKDWSQNNMNLTVYNVEETTHKSNRFLPRMGTKLHVKHHKLRTSWTWRCYFLKNAGGEKKTCDVITLLSITVLHQMQNGGFLCGMHSKTGNKGVEKPDVETKDIRATKNVL